MKPDSELQKALALAMSAATTMIADKRADKARIEELENENRRLRVEQTVMRAGHKALIQKWDSVASKR